MIHRVIFGLGNHARLVAAWLAAIVWLAAPARAGHETDNFYLPLDRDFADLGSYFDSLHAGAIEQVVSDINRRIESALKTRDPQTRARRLAELHDPELIVSEVQAKFDDAFSEWFDIEHALDGDWAAKMYPGKIVSHSSADWMFTYVHFPLDPRRLILLFQSSTVKAYGVYFGTDKILHFHHMGSFYYDDYRARVKNGHDPQAALASVIREYSTGGIISEASFLGNFATGVYSNGDLAANYAGFKFLLNLTEPVTLKGELREPLVIRCGNFWRLSTRVRPESGWFGDFVSDHWNEALNPDLYDSTIRTNVRGLLRRRAKHIIDFYTIKDHRPAKPEYYDALAHELSTLYGEPYGHSGQWDKLFTLGNTCFPALAPADSAQPATPTTHGQAPALNQAPAQDQPPTSK